MGEVRGRGRGPRHKTQDPRPKIQDPRTKTNKWSGGGGVGR